MSILNVAKKSQKASLELLQCDERARNSAIRAIATILRKNADKIIKENGKDLKLAKGLSPALIDRLKITQTTIDQMAKACEEIANQKEVVGQIVHEFKRNDGLVIQKQRIPLGVIAMVFESRPNVVIDCSALAIKSGNAIILKGGKEAKFSNKILGNLVQEAVKEFIPAPVVQVLSSTDRKGILELIQLKDFVNVVIPRGGAALVEFVYKKSQIPVIAHFKGLCHLFIDESADLKKVISIILNAKVQRPGVCNAIETLLIHEKISAEFVKEIIINLKAGGVEIRGCPRTLKLDPSCKKATKNDFDTEYLDKIISVKIVKNCDEAIEHIHAHGTHHTESILSENKENINKFLSQIDASCVMVNASTRFNDGGELGLGAEIGISTSKFHAYGPMGAAEMTTSRFIVRGNYHTRN